MKKHNLIKKEFAAFALSTAMVFSMFPAITPAPIANAATAATEASNSQKVTTAEDDLENIFTTIDLMDASISELSTAMEKGELTAVQLVQMYLDRINAYDKSLNLNSIISINPDALTEAAKLDQLRAEGKIKGKLHGIPIIVKDNYDVAGMATTAGSASLANSIALDDCYVVKKLKEQGAIILAKANMSEFASSGSDSRSTLGGTVHNPYDTTRSSAGSSGGTAVAVTCNFAAAGLGTDTGSSIRRPSSFNNLYGIRPSKGLTSIDGVIPLNADRDVTGPLCRSAEDLAIMLEGMAGTDPADSYTADANNLIPSGGYTSNLTSNSLKGKKIGYLSNSFGYSVLNTGEVATGSAVSLDNKISGMVTKAKSNLVKAGATLVDVSNLIPETLITSLRQKTSYSVFEWDMNEYLASLGENAPCKTVKDIMNTGLCVNYININVKNPANSLSEMTNPRTTEDWNTCWNNMLNFRTTISKILKDNGIDAVIYVSQTDVANVQEENANLAKTTVNKNNAASYINYFGPVAGLPDMMMPMGFAKTDAANGYTEKMPLGMSMFTSYGNEETLFEIAYAYEQQAGSSIRKAPDSVPALKDENVNAYLDNLMDAVYSIDYDKYTVYPEAKIKKMYSKYDAAEKVNTNDIYETYDAAYDLAVAYDAVLTALNGKEKVETPTVSKPAKAKILNVSRTASNKKITITMQKQKEIAGYKIQYSTSKNFTSPTTKTVTSSTVKKAVNKLNAKKTYYVRVRAYKTSNTKKIYGAWSAIKKISITK